MDIEVRWILSDSASCFHAAEAVRRGRAVTDARLAAVIGEPTKRLSGEIQACGLTEEKFWRHLVPLAAGIENNRELVELVLRKMIGTNTRAASLVAPLAGRVADVEAAVRAGMPGLIDELTAPAGNLRKQWDARGVGVLRGVARMTDERLFVSRADAIVVYPAFGGGGAAHLPYNSIRIEAVGADPHADLPEVVRLIWMTSQLNVDLPMFSETIHRSRRPRLAALSMLPATLAAAENVELARLDLKTVQLALSAWDIENHSQADLAETVLHWWETYAASRPAWNVALGALDQMLES